MAHPQPGEQTKRYFVSYTQNDRAWAEWVAFELKALGNTVIIQAWDIHSGHNFALEMQKAAANSDHTVPILSEAFFRSNFTKPEIAAAFADDPTGENAN